MSRVLFALASVMVLATITSADDTESGSRIQKQIRIPANIGFGTNVSDDGQVATVIFDNVSIEADPVGKSTHGSVANQTEMQTKTVTLNIPYSTDQRSLEMRVDVRGYSDADTGATARLIACVGDTTKVIDLTPDEKEVKLKGNSKQRLAADHGETEAGDFEERVEFTVAKHAEKPILQVTLLLVVEHDTDTADSGGALLVVDSLDLAIVAPGKGKYKK